MFILIGLLLGVLTLTALYTDFKGARIPNWLTAGFIPAAGVLHFVYEGWRGLGLSLCSAAAGFAVLFLLYAIKAVGAGDVKWFAALGALTGMVFSMYVLFYAIVFAGIVGVGFLLWRGVLFAKLRALFARLFVTLMNRNPGLLLQTDKRTLITFPFMYAVFPATCLAYLQYLI